VLFGEQAGALARGGVDAIFIETMSSLDEAKAAVEAAQEACDLPVFCCFSFDAHGRTGMGVSPGQAAQAMAELGVPAMGANCGHVPEELLDILPRMREAAPEAFLIAKPNAGVPRMVKREVVYDAGPDRMAEMASALVGLGASIVGACCGSSPDHVAAMASVVQEVDGDTT
jgi:5-methyltetrahydrofolate--homocysteine methyltransferase